RPPSVRAPSLRKSRRDCGPGQKADRLMNFLASGGKFYTNKRTRDNTLSQSMPSDAVLRTVAIAYASASVCCTISQIRFNTSAGAGVDGSPFSAHCAALCRMISSACISGVGASLSFFVGRDSDLVSVSHSRGLESCLTNERGLAWLGLSNASLQSLSACAFCWRYTCLM